MAWRPFRIHSNGTTENRKVHSGATMLSTNWYSASTKSRVGSLPNWTSFSTRPLRLASITGGVTAVLGFLAALWSILAWFTGESIPGWTSVIVVVLVLGGIQLLVVGILGEYLGRLFMESKGRPAFIIADVVSKRRGDECVE